MTTPDETSYDDTARAPRVAAILTCFNRRALTLASLAAITESAALAGVELAIYIVDDGSRDGTADAVRAAFPHAHVIMGTGSLYWNQGMRLAWSTARADDPDFYLMLNDDLAVRPAALGGALATWRAAGDGPVVVGKTVDPDSGAVSYGGYCRASRHSRLSYRHLHAGETECDTMTGNFVLIPRAVVAAIGILDAHYSHGWGDIDYGLRVRRAGFRIVEHAEPVGTQALNEAFRRASTMLTLKTLRFTLTHPKGVPAREWLYFCRQHAGPRWPLNFVVRYGRMAFNGMVQR